MKGRADFSKVKEQGQFSDLPAGEYLAEIVEVKEGFTQNGDPMPAIKLQILKSGFEDCWVWDNIIISDNPDSPGYKILGRSKLFLHCIGEPYEGDMVAFDTDNWKGRKVRIETDVELPNQYHKYKKAIVAKYILEELSNNKPESAQDILDPAEKDPFTE